MYEKTNSVKSFLFPSAKVKQFSHLTKSVQPIPKIFQPNCIISEIFSIFVPKIKHHGGPPAQSGIAKKLPDPTKRRVR